MKTDMPRIVIIGGGFGGLNAAKALGDIHAQITLIDSRNFHLFQPLLYQVATGGLSPADISFPIRAVFTKQKNVNVVLGKVTDIDLTTQHVYVSEKYFEYDYLIIATGVRHHYFGNDQWSQYARGLKTIEDATTIRSKLLSSFEKAELETDREKHKELLTFVIIGGGPTGVELSGALAELANATLKDDFRKINSSEANIILVEGTERILPVYPPKLSKQAEKILEKFNVQVMTQTMVTKVDSSGVTIKRNDELIRIKTKNILWAAGVKAVSLGKLLINKYNLQHDRNNRLSVDNFCRLHEYNNVFVIGDLANFSDENKIALPGTAPVAIQQGKYIAGIIKNLLRGKRIKAFRYFDKGNLAVIGRSYAVAFRGNKKFSGFIAWLLWIFVHLLYLIGFENRVLVAVQWAFNYFTRNRSARLITNTIKKITVDENEKESY